MAQANEDHFGVGKMANKEEVYLYCLVFDQPITERRELISTLEAVGCKDVMQGGPVFSIEFRLDTSLWEDGHWINWEHLVGNIQKGYGFNLERSCLPEQGGDRNGENEKN